MIFFISILISFSFYQIKNPREKKKFMRNILIGKGEIILENYFFHFVSNYYFPYKNHCCIANIVFLKKTSQDQIY